MRTRGKYRDGFPKGLVVHFTAGRSRGGVLRNRKTNAEQGQQSVRHAVDKGSYCYFVLDRDGNVYQNFPLDRWGYHAGKSSWKGLSGSVSDELVGIEIMNAGKMEEKKGDQYYAWFTGSKDTPFSEKEVRHIEKDTENQDKGTYQKYSEEQEEALLELVVWLKRTRPEVFNLDFVLGHDEVSPGRKNDPGGSLSMTMPDFRNKIKETYKGRY
jgi:N-acetyl-anhydromuramyl-L-alanine amidase AmpD